MIKKLIFISLIFTYSITAFRIVIKNEKEIPHGSQLQGLYLNGMGRKFPKSMSYLSREQKHDQKYRTLITYLETIITNGIIHHKNNNLTLPHDGHMVDQELDLIIKKINLEEPLQEIEKRIGLELPVHSAYCEVTSVFTQNN